MKQILSFIGTIVPYLIFVLLLPFSLLAWVVKGFMAIIRRIVPIRSEQGKTDQP